MNATSVASPEATALARRVRDFIVSNFYVADPGALSDEDSLLVTGIVDSTGMLEVIGFLESEMGVAVLDQEMVPENLETISRIASFVGRKRGGAAA